MKSYTYRILLALLMMPLWTQAQQISNKTKLDSLFIDEIQETLEPDKVLHAEPLYIDLIRDLGARKGEKEWNLGVGLNDRVSFDEYEALIEYEFAPINRLGLEFELPFSFYYPGSGDVAGDSIPSSRMHSLKMAAQYTFLVKQRWKTSMALGYIHEFELVEFTRYSEGSPFSGNIFNPFFIAAKRFGDNWHTLVYTGPVLEKPFGEALDMHWQVNTNFHYMIPGTRNFIGVEVNQEVDQGSWSTVLRPQMRVGLADNLLVGIVSGIPLRKGDERLSAFLRLIYEPGHRHPKAP
jgi:hypothetical protein